MPLTHVRSTLSALTRLRPTSWLRHYVVMGIAAGLAWVASDAVSHVFEAFTVPPMVAAITAVLTVQSNLHKASGEAITQLVGTAVGAVLALALAHTVLPDALAAGLAVTGAFLVARMLRLGEEAAVLLPITALIVLGPGLAEATAADRLGATLIGAVIAVVCSLLSERSTPLEHAEDLVTGLADGTALLLSDVAAGAAGGHDIDQALGWLERARELNVEVDAVRAACQEAVGFARWYPKASQAEAAALYARFLAVEHTVVSVRAVTRTLVEAAERNVPLPGPAVGVALEAAARATEAHAAAALPVDEELMDTQELEAVSSGGVLVVEPAETVAETVTALEEASAALVDHAAQALNEPDGSDTGAMTAAMAVSLQRIADSISMDTEAIRSTSVASNKAPGVAAVEALASGVAAPVRLTKRMRTRRRRTKSVRSGS